MKAVVIFSGGQDSMTCLYWAVKQYGIENVAAITFAYRQKHEVEVRQAERVCRMEGITQCIVDIGFLNDIVDSAMLTHGDVNVLNEKGLPASFVPNRNQLFITLAHSYAQKIGADVLVTGVCQTDYSGYPDCRDKFINSIEKVTNYGSQTEIKIHTPLMFLTKAQTFDLAYTLGVLDTVIKHSHTCYNGDRQTKHAWGYGCGTCPACELRAKGYSEFLMLEH